VIGLIATGKIYLFKTGGYVIVSRLNSWAESNLKTEKLKKKKTYSSKQVDDIPCDVE
jgi:hypothetical protein